MPDIMPKTNWAAKIIRKSHCSPSGVSQIQDSWWVFLFSMAFMHLWTLLLDIPISPLILLTETTARLQINKKTKLQRNLMLINMIIRIAFSNPFCQKTDCLAMRC
jgi:hypothetical protein